MAESLICFRGGRNCQGLWLDVSVNGEIQARLGPFADERERNAEKDRMIEKLAASIGMQPLTVN